MSSAVRPPTRLWSLLVAFAVLLTVSAGCANYRLGTAAAPAFRTVYVEPVANRTHLPQAQAAVSTRLRETLARDGRLTLVNSAAEADVTLTLVLTGYRRDVSAVREDDTGLARKFNVTLAAAYTVRDNRAGKLLADQRPLTAVREVFTDGGQLQAEYQALPLLAETLAGKVVRAFVDAW